MVMVFYIDYPTEKVQQTPNPPAQVPLHLENLF